MGGTGSIALMHSHSFCTTAQSGNGYQHIVHDSHKEDSKAQKSVNDQTLLYIGRSQMTFHQWNGAKFNFPAIKL